MAYIQAGKNYYCVKFSSEDNRPIVKKMFLTESMKLEPIGNGKEYEGIVLSSKEYVSSEVDDSFFSLLGVQKVTNFSIETILALHSFVYIGDAWRIESKWSNGCFRHDPSRTCEGGQTFVLNRANGWIEVLDKSDEIIFYQPI